MALNRITIMGRIGGDIELRSTPNGTAVATFSLAVERDYKNQNGEKEVDWLDVVAWKQTAEFASKHLGKGRNVVVEGKLQTRTFIDQNNYKRKAIEVIADNIYFADSKRDNEANAPYAMPDGFTSPASSNDDDCPF